MGSWSEQQEVKKEVKEKEKTSRETLGKFFYDLAKISFTALVVGSVVSVATQQEKVENWVLILIGIFVTYIFSYIGNYMEALISLFAVMAVIGSIIAVWLNTKSGKKWLANL